MPAQLPIAWISGLLVARCPSQGLLLKFVAETNCWDYLLRSAVESICSGQLLVPVWFLFGSCLVPSRLVGWLVGLVGWLAGWLVGRLVGWLADWLAGRAKTTETGGIRCLWEIGWREWGADEAVGGGWAGGWAVKDDEDSFDKILKIINMKQISTKQQECFLLIWYQFLLQNIK